MEIVAVTVESPLVVSFLCDRIVTACFRSGTVATFPSQDSLLVGTPLIFSCLVVDDKIVVGAAIVVGTQIMVNGIFPFFREDERRIELIVHIHRSAIGRSFGNLLSQVSIAVVLVRGVGTPQGLWHLVVQVVTGVQVCRSRDRSTVYFRCQRVGDSSCLCEGGNTEKQYGYH